MGYSLKTLHEALKLPGATIRNLPPPPTPHAVRSHIAGSKPSLEDGLPEFSTSTLMRFLVKFIVADDQVWYLFKSQIFDS